MIEMRSVSKWFGDKRAIDELSFTIQEGEIVGLLGLNGAGKSTVLKTLGTLLQASEGEAFINGFSVRSQAEEVRRQIGYLPDTPPVYDEMTVEAYLRFVAQIKDVPATDRRAALEETLAKTHLEEVRAVRISELSHGFRQRVSIAQALIHRPKVLILDEPINGLDPVQIVEMRDLINSLRRQHTVILSSHILSEITRTCDRILVIDRGRLKAEGREDELRGQATDGLIIEVELAERAGYYGSLLQGKDKIHAVEVVSDRVLRLNMLEDVRPEIARALIHEGADLLRLEKKEAELEALFMKLVSGGEL